MVEKIRAYVELGRPDLLRYRVPSCAHEIKIDSEKAIAREITIEWSEIIKSFRDINDLINANINISKIVGEIAGEELRAYYESTGEIKPVSEDAENIRKRAMSKDQPLIGRLLGYRAYSRCGGSEEALEEFLEAKEKAENKKNSKFLRE